MHKFELLAPAGSFEILKAVIAAGADAVYVGGNMFGARAYANNFTQEELLEAIDYVHLRGKRLFLTVNTLMKNAEIENYLFDFLDVLYKQGLDGVIVQDLGAVKFISESFPDLEIHTSTQMTITGVEGANLLKQYGVTRVVMAREVSLDEMKKIHDETGLELEAFVHGALCYCYSGQCLFSSLLGGRSGNRGRCAQPCRLMYSVLDHNNSLVKKDTYILSMKDLCGLEDISNLAEAGVFSLKIEGRMKQVDYAAGVVAMYRKYIDLYYAKNNNNVSSLDKKIIADYGNRCGFTNNYYYRHNSSDMVTFEKPSYEKKDTDILMTIEESKLKINGKARLHLGEQAYFEVNYLGLLACSYGLEVSKANNRPVNAEDVVQRLRKTGDTPFEFKDIELEMDEDVFIPNGALNQLRRDALDYLKEMILKEFRRDNSLRPKNRLIEKTQCLENVYVASVHTSEQLMKVVEYPFIQDIYINVYKYNRKNLAEDLKKDCDLVIAKGKNVYLALPKIFREAERKFYTSIYELLQGLPLYGVVVSNYESLAFVKEYLSHLKIVIDHNMYTYNDYSINAFEKLGVDINTIPLELNKQEILHRNNQNSEMIVYGHYPLMVSAQCVHRNCVGCDKNKTTMYLKDRYNALFPVRNHCDECYNVIYNSIPTLLSSPIDELLDNGISRFRISFTVENDIETDEILRVFADQISGKRVDTSRLNRKFTNGHFKRGVE